MRILPTVALLGALVAGVNALPSVAWAQGVQMTYDQWVGPPLQQQSDIQVTWQGVTRYGFTAYVRDPATGNTGVVWQQTPNSPWLFKGSNGNTAIISADGNQMYDTTPQYQAPAPVYSAPPPPRYSPGYSSANYGWTSWRWTGR
jgi:hypothetical protein